MWTVLNLELQKGWNIHLSKRKAASVLFMCPKSYSIGFVISIEGMDWADHMTRCLGHGTNEQHRGSNIFLGKVRISLLGLHSDRRWHAFCMRAAFVVVPACALSCTQTTYRYWYRRRGCIGTATCQILTCMQEWVHGFKAASVCSDSCICFHFCGLPVRSSGRVRVEWQAQPAYRKGVKAHLNEAFLFMYGKLLFLVNIPYTPSFHIVWHTFQNVLVQMMKKMVLWIKSVIDISDITELCKACTETICLHELLP